MEKKRITELIIRNVKNDFYAFPDFVKIIGGNEFREIIEQNYEYREQKKEKRGLKNFFDNSADNIIEAFAGLVLEPGISGMILSSSNPFAFLTGLSKVRVCGSCTVNIIGIIGMLSPIIQSYLSSSSEAAELASVISIGTVVLSIINAFNISPVVELDENPAKVYSFMLKELLYRPVNYSWEICELIDATQLSGEEMLSSIGILIKKLLVAEKNDRYSVKKKVEFKLSGSI
ncbi:MAG: hypothetical protein Q4D40_07010 [Eubacteriales bacterium]|nr:hypothetical protein [Eubacteriales bacterium]